MYDDTNRGVLFHNDKKSDKAPDYTGKYNHEGTEIKLAGWIRTSSKTGTQFISISRDDYVPPDGDGYNNFKQQGEALKAKVEDTVAEVPDGEIDLSSIPF